MVTEAWGQPQVDLFSNQQNAKVPSFFMLQREDRALGLDAFTHPWDYQLFYALPPFQLFLLVLRNFREENMDLILVAPFLAPLSGRRDPGLRIS